jgi:hypothetical protein
VVLCWAYNQYNISTYLRLIQLLVFSSELIFNRFETEERPALYYETLKMQLEGEEEVDFTKTQELWEVLGMPQFSPQYLAASVGLTDDRYHSFKDLEEVHASLAKKVIRVDDDLVVISELDHGSKGRHIDKYEDNVDGEDDGDRYGTFDYRHDLKLYGQRKSLKYAKYFDVDEDLLNRVFNEKEEESEELYHVRCFMTLFQSYSQS